MCGYLCSRTWPHTWLLVQTDSPGARVCAPRARSVPARCPRTLGRPVRVCGEGAAEEHGQTPCSRRFPRRQQQTRWGSPRGQRGPAHRCSHSRASWQRQDNMPWGAKPLGSPLKCLMRSDTYHLKSPACPRSRTATSLLLISLRSLCWLLNNKHRRGRCD